MKYKSHTTTWLFLLIILISTGLSAQSLNLTGYARNYTGVLLKGNNKYSIIQNTFNLNFKHSKDKVAFKVNPYLYHYFDKDLELGLREAYLDIYFNSIDIRVGKQQIIWGKADGVFITDIVSPKDLREFLLPDFDEIRIGITAVKADYYLRNNTVELVWIPVFTPTRMPEENSIWSVTPDFPIQPTFDYSEKDIEKTLKNSEGFVKYSALTSLVDFEIMAGYTWDDDLTMHMTKMINPNTQEIDSLIVTPRYHRLSLAGGSFSTTLGGFVLCGEGAYYKGKYFNSNALSLTDGVVKKDYLHYLMGLNRTLWNIRLSVQFIQQVILYYDDQIANDEFENTMTFLLSKDLLRETLHVELFSYLGLNNQDALIRPKITYDLADGFEILVGANVFVGSEGRFGQYDDNDMIYSKVKYSF